MTARGRFIVVEGGDGSGKSTQVAVLAERMRKRGHDVLATFEPGATAAGAAIRGLVLGSHAVLDDRTEALLIAADRAQHIAEVVRPSLALGRDVVSDRYVPSSLAYQGRGRGLGADTIGRLNRWAADGLEPDLVVVLDVPATVAAARRGAPLDRVEREDDGFHEAVREAYRELSRSEGWALVDGSRTVDEVATDVWAIVQSRFDW